MDSNTTATVTLDTTMNEMRASLKTTAEQILAVKKTVQASEVNGVEDRNEEIANLTLAYRHMEDCIMRLGKVIQAFNGGKSIYDKTAATATENDSSSSTDTETSNVAAPAANASAGQTDVSTEAKTDEATTQASA